MRRIAKPTSPRANQDSVASSGTPNLKVCCCNTKVPGNPVGCTSKVTIPSPPNSGGMQFNTREGNRSWTRCVRSVRAAGRAN